MVEDLFLLFILSFFSLSLLWLYCLHSVVPQTTVILNNDRQNSIVAKMVGQEEPLTRAADSLESILGKLVTNIALSPQPSPPSFTKVSLFSTGKQVLSLYQGDQNSRLLQTF